MTTAGRTRAPIALQLVALLVCVLIAAQVMTFAVVVLMPPPNRPVYRMEEVAQALKGGPLQTKLGHDLVRSVERTPPAEPAPRRPGQDGDFRRRPPPEWSRRELATILGAREADVRLVQRSRFPPWMMRWPLGLRVPGRFETHVERGPSGPDAPGGGPRVFVFGAGGPPLFGDFAAALRRSDGQWLVVRPRPEPFPNEWQRLLLLWLGGCLLITAPLGYLFARRITAPIGRFAHAAETLGRDPSGPLMELTGPAEIGMAAQAFNEMQARLKRYIEDRTAMVGAISHDLRTPLARIRFKLEGAPEPVRGAVLADIEQMEQMIGSVLAFIRDASAGRPRERLDLLSLVECLVDDAVQTGQDVTLARAVPATVEADALGLQRLFGNLVDNAVKYGDRARITVTLADGEAEVEIADSGPGLAPGELERVFQPFYRADAARTLDGRGVGLGLAVARSIARAHGGDVILLSAAKGLIARVRLPLSAG